MQKHQEWLDNRSYEQHLECLKKIKARKNNSANITKKIKKHSHSKQSHQDGQQKQNRISNLNPYRQDRQNSQYGLEPFQYQVDTERKSHKYNKTSQKFNRQQCKKQQLTREKVNCFSSRNPFSTNQNFFNRSRKGHTIQKGQSKDVMNISLKEQQLLWNNFLLGKRILQTGPVICKRKLDIQYQKHKQLVKSRTAKRLHENSNFRLRKLQEHNDKIYKISDDHRIENNLHKHFMVNLVIQSIQIFKYKFSSFQNIILVMKYGYHFDNAQKEPLYPVPKRTKQVSQCIPSSMLTSYNFFFTLKKKKFQQNVPIVIEIKNVKSLNVISIGTFSFQFDENKQITMKETNLYNFGKLIGNVKFNAHFGKKNEFLSHIE